MPLADASDIDRAVQSARRAFPAWRATPPLRRARVMFEFKRLVEANMNELAEILSSEHGKVIADKRPRGRPPKHARPIVVVDEVPVPPHLLRTEQVA